MTKKSLLSACVARHIHESGKRMEWWPYETREQLDEFFRTNGISLRGNGDHILVGLNNDQDLVVQEIHGITDAANVSTQAFILSYKHLFERVLNENSI
jgi:hypothetical protein